MFTTKKCVSKVWTFGQRSIKHRDEGPRKKVLALRTSSSELIRMRHWYPPFPVDQRRHEYAASCAKIVPVVTYAVGDKCRIRAYVALEKSSMCACLAQDEISQARCRPSAMALSKSFRDLPFSPVWVQAAGAERRASMPACLPPLSEAVPFRTCSFPMQAARKSAKFRPAPALPTSDSKKFRLHFSPILPECPAKKTKITKIRRLDKKYIIS